MRYVNLSIILVFRLVSKKVMDRFPDYESLVEAKLMLPSEVKRLEKTDERTPHESTWAPISWAMKLITLGKWMKKPQWPFLHFSSKIDVLCVCNFISRRYRIEMNLEDF